MKKETKEIFPSFTELLIGGVLVLVFLSIIHAFSESFGIGLMTMAIVAFVFLAFVALAFKAITQSQEIKKLKKTGRGIIEN